MKHAPRKPSRVAGRELVLRRSSIASCILLALLAGSAHAAPATCGPPNVSSVNGTGVGCGDGAVASASGAVAVGYEAKATADNAIALGKTAQAAADNSLALGAGAIVDAGAAGSIALGAGSHATGVSLAAPAYLTGTTATSELSIGMRRITKVADGANNDDAATVGQLKAANVGNDLAVRYYWTDANSNRIVDAGEIDYSRVILGADPKTGVPIPGGVVVSNVKDGAVTGTSNEAVNGSQLFKVEGLAKKGWYLSADGGATGQNIAPGDTATFAAGTNATVTRSGATVTVGVVDAPTFAGRVTANGGLTVTTGGLTVNGGQTVDMGGNVLTNVAAGKTALHAVNVSQLAALGADIATALGGASTFDPNTQSLTAALDIDGVAYGNVNDALDAVNATANKGWTVRAGSASENVAPGDTVTLASGTNTIASYDAGSNELKVSVVDAPIFTGMVTAGGGLTVATGKTVDMGGNVVTGVARGVGAGDAVNKAQLDEIEAAAGLGWNLQVDGGATDNIGGGETVKVAATSNADVSYDAANNTMTIAVVDNPTFAGQVTAAGGLSVTGGGFTVAAGQFVDMGGNVIDNVGTGSIDASSAQAINGAQLFGISQSVADAFGGGSVVASDGSIAAPAYALTNANAIGGDSGEAKNVGQGFEKVDAALGALRSNITDITDGGAGIRYFHVISDGADSVATGTHTVAIGPDAIASQGEAIAVGHGAQAINGAATALGSGAWAHGYQSTAVGFFADTRGDYSSAFGSALAFGEGTTALGAWAFAGGSFDWTGAGGARPGDIVEIVNGTAVGFSSVATADHATAIGAQAQARGVGTLALGHAANASAVGSVAVGEGASATLGNSVALGAGAVTSDVVGTQGAVINGSQYAFAGATPAGTVSVGSAGQERTITHVAAGRVDAASTDAVNGSQLFATNQAVEAISSVAGNANDLAVKYRWTDANRDGVATEDEIDYGNVALAGAGGTRVSNVAPGAIAMTSMDAINGGQLFQSMAQVADMLGGGASMTAQGLTAPTYLIQGVDYHDVGAALQALDIQMTLIDGRPYGSQLKGYTHDRDVGGSLDGDGGAGSTALGANATAAGVEDAVAIGEGASVTANGGTAVGQGASVSADGAVALGKGSVADRADTVSVGSAGNERQVVNVAAGTQPTDAVNKGQLDRGVASANGYTDARVNALSDSFDVFQGKVAGELQRQDERIDRQGAMSAAMMNMAVSASGIRTPNRVGIGVGFQGGESAVSMGYQRAISDRATVTVGGAFSSDDSAVGLGAGFGW